MKARDNKIRLGRRIATLAALARFKELKTSKDKIRVAGLQALVQDLANVYEIPIPLRVVRGTEDVMEVLKEMGDTLPNLGHIVLLEDFNDVVDTLQQFAAIQQYVNHNGLEPDLNKCRKWAFKMFRTVFPEDPIHKNVM